MSNRAIRKISKIKGFTKLLYSPLFGLVVFVESMNEKERIKIRGICDRRGISIRLID